MRSIRIWHPALVAVTAILLFAPPAAAYIDPTAAGAAMQSMYVVGMSLFMGLAMAPRKIAGWCARLLRRGQPEVTDGE